MTEGENNRRQNKTDGRRERKFIRSSRSRIWICSEKLDTILVTVPGLCSRKDLHMNYLGLIMKCCIRVRQVFCSEFSEGPNFLGVFRVLLGMF